MAEKTTVRINFQMIASDILIKFCEKMLSTKFS